MILIPWQEAQLQGRKELGEATNPPLLLFLLGSLFTTFYLFALHSIRIRHEASTQSNRFDFILDITESAATWKSKTLVGFAFSPIYLLF